MPWINRIYASAVRFSGKQRNLRVFAAGLLIISVLAGWYYKPSGTPFYLLTAIVISFSVALLAPRIIRPVLLIWMIVTGILGEIVATTVIFVIYFLLFTPIALIKRNVTVKGWQETPGNTDYKKMY